jgi:hypothetical protein
MCWQGQAPEHVEGEEQEERKNIEQVYEKIEVVKYLIFKLALSLPRRMSPRRSPWSSTRAEAVVQICRGNGTQYMAL